MNILLTCVGRRSYMVEYFKEAIGDKYKVIGVNSDSESTGMAIVDKAYIVPKVNSRKYIPKLICM